MEDGVESILNERGESKLEFLRRMLDLVKDKDELGEIIKNKIISEIKNKNSEEIGEQLITKLNNLSLELDIDLDKIQ